MTWGVSNPDALAGCKHQFFEIKDISYSPMGKEGERIVMYPQNNGKLVMCAVCGERRQLWENGDILFFINGDWQKLPGM